MFHSVTSSELRDCRYLQINYLYQVAFVMDSYLGAFHLEEVLCKVQVLRPLVQVHHDQVVGVLILEVLLLGYLLVVLPILGS